jgi:ribonuclease HIII
VAADALLAFSRSRLSLYAAGTIVSLAFFMLYYPLITYTYNEVFESKVVWPSMIAQIYFEMIQNVFSFVAIPAAVMGILGALVIDKFARNKNYPKNTQRMA